MVGKYQVGCKSVQGVKVVSFVIYPGIVILQTTLAQFPMEEFQIRAAVFEKQDFEQRRHVWLKSAYVIDKIMARCRGLKSRILSWASIPPHRGANPFT
jgi:hypothetical protein